MDPQRFAGTVYKAANWSYLGHTKGFRRTRQGYTATARSPKLVFVKPLQAHARALLSRPILEEPYRHGVPKIRLRAEQMYCLPDFFRNLADPRRAQGRRHPLPTILAIAAGASLCGIHGYKAIAGWAQSLGTKARERFGCRREKGRRVVPSEYVIRDVLVRIDPVALDRALQRWNEIYGEDDESLAIGGKTLCHAIDEQGIRPIPATPKKVGTLPVEGDDEAKRTNEIKTAAPLLEAIAIQGKEITADALLTQRKFAAYLVEDRPAHYHFTVKGNQPQLFEDLRRYFEDRREPDFVVGPSLEHGRIETRKIGITCALNDYLDFPHVGQAFVIERQRIEKKTGKHSIELAYGLTSRPPEQADAQQVLKTNRGHWSVENRCHDLIDWNFDEDRGRIRTGHGPENISRLRRFAVGILKSKGVESVAEKMRQLHRNTRLVFDYLRMSKNTCATACA